MIRSRTRFYTLSIVIIVISLLLISRVTVIALQETPSPTATATITLTSTRTLVDLTLFRDRDSLTLFVPGTEAISLKDVYFEVVRNNIPEDHLLSTYTQFQGINLERVPAPICLRLVRKDTFPEAVQICKDINRIFDQPVAPADVFWINSTSGEQLPVTIGRLGETFQICAATLPTCDIRYPLPPSPTPTNTPTPSETPNVETLVALTFAPQTVEAGTLTAQAPTATMTYTPDIAKTVNAAVEQTSVVLTQTALSAPPPTKTPNFQATQKSLSDQATQGAVNAQATQDTLNSQGTAQVQRAMTVGGHYNLQGTNNGTPYTGTLDISGAGGGIYTLNWHTSGDTTGIGVRFKNDYFAAAYGAGCGIDVSQIQGGGKLSGIWAYNGTLGNEVDSPNGAINDLIGNYTVNSSSHQSDTLSVTTENGYLQFAWSSGGAIGATGFGIRDGNMVAIAYAAGQNYSGCGVALYRIDSNGNLSGQWAYGGGSSGTENAYH